MKTLILFSLFCFLPFMQYDILAQSSQSKKTTVLDFTPRVPQEIIVLARQRVSNKKTGSINNGVIIEKQRYEILNCTSSVSANFEYNIVFKVIDTATNEIVHLWIQYSKTEEGKYVCSKDTIF